MASIFDKKLMFPTDYVSLSRGWISGSHYGIDLAWNSKYGGGNVDIHAPADGRVVAIQEGMGNTYGSSSWGNYVKIDHGDGVYTLSGHVLKGSINEIGLKVGDVVVRGQKIGRMNNSGNSSGNHDHFEVYLGGSGTGYRVDPLKYTYAYSHQVIGDGSALRSSIMRLDESVIPTGQVGTPVERNTAVNQVEVLIDDLRARVRPEMNDGVILGYIKKGVYNVVATRDMTQEASNGYYWYEVEPGVWIAKGEKWTSYYLAEAEPPVDDDKDKQIAELQKENAAYVTAFGDIKKIVDGVI